MKTASFLCSRTVSGKESWPRAAPTAGLAKHGLARTSYARRTLLGLFLASAVCIQATAALPGVTELGTSPEALSDRELAALLDAHIKPVDVIALGETLHGSSGFLRVQARLIRYLIERHGFRLIVWETAVLRSVEMSDWLAACAERKAPAPLAVLYMPTKSDLPLWEWLCDFNRARPASPVIFRGMDVWDRPWEHYAKIRTLSATVGVPLVLLNTVEKSCAITDRRTWAEIDALLQLVAAHGGFPAEEYGQCRTALENIVDFARQADARIIGDGAKGDEAFDLALSASTLLGWLGFYHYHWTDDIASWNERDRAQGRNTMLLMEKHGMQRSIVAAHASHASHNRSPADWWGYGDLKSGVYFLASTTGKKVFNIAFTAYEASGTQGTWSVPIAKNSLDKTLHDAGHIFAFVPSDAPFLAAHEKWWIQNGNFPGPYESGVELVLRDHFDAFFWFDRSHLDEALPSRPMWQP
jgi:erythromycin esterase-like protein